MSSMDELIQRIKNQSTAKATTQPEAPKAVEVKAVTAKRTKPMPNGRTTRHNTHHEHYTDTQITAALDAARTMQEAYPCLLEIQNRLGKHHDTLGVIALEKMIQNRYDNPQQSKSQPNPKPEPEYEEEPEPPPPVNLTWDIIKEIEADQCAYAPYLTEIWNSNWDYKDRRPRNVPMEMSQENAKNWTDTHRNDHMATRSSLSEYQAGFIMVLLKAYYYHKCHPDVQYKAAAAEAPPF